MMFLYNCIFIPAIKINAIEDTSRSLGESVMAPPFWSVNLFAPVVLLRPSGLSYALTHDVVITCGAGDVICGCKRQLLGP